MDYIVTAPLVIPRDTAGKVRYLYQGSPVPADLAAGEVARLLGDRLITATGDDTPPARSASKGAWVDYAVAHGVGQDEAQKATRDQLADRFLGPAEQPPTPED